MKDTGKFSSKGISRRDFLKGGLAGATGIALLGLYGCSSETETESSTAVPLQTAQVNTQAAVTETTVIHSWDIIPDPITDIAETFDADIIVVGAGMAGMNAFVSASENGASTILIEKRETFSSRGLATGGIGSRLQKAEGVEIDKTAVIKDLMQAAGYKANGNLLKLWADYSGEAIDHELDICDANGLSYYLSTDVKADSTDTDGFWERNYRTDHNIASFLHEDLMQAMEKTGIDNGGTIYYNMQAVQLVQDSSLRVTGVIAQDGDGNYIQFNASKGVILSTGDYSGNPEMVDAWCTIAKEVGGSVYNQVGGNAGDGFNMALWAGACMQKGDHAPMIHPIFGGGEAGTYAFLRVNKSGNRFCNEDTPLPGITNSYMVSPGHVVWTIMDSHWDEQIPLMTNQSIYSGTTSGPLYTALGILPADATYQDCMEKAIEDGNSIRTESLEALADAIGVNKEAFLKTVTRYNELAVKGVDEDFGKSAKNMYEIKDGPFYASKVNAMMLVIASGLNVDDKLKVCRDDGTAIEGLYAIGNAQGNFFANDYPLICPGLSHGRCVTFGYLLGRALAKDEFAQ